MNIWKGLGKFFLVILAVVGGVLAVFELGMKLKVFEWIIPDWVFLILIILLFSITLYTVHFIRRNGEKKNNLDGKKINKKLEPDLEMMLILKALALKKELYEETLFKIYNAFFKEKKGEDDFNIAVARLSKNELIVPSFYITGEKSWCISSSGLEYYDKHRNMKAKKLDFLVL